MKIPPLALRLLAFLLLAPSLPAADPPSRPIGLNQPKPLRSGTEIREKRTILVPRGRSKQVNAKETSDVSTRYSQRLNLVHRLGSAGTAADVRVSEAMSEWTHFTGPTPPPNEQSSPLMSKTLRARKTGARWDYELDQGKPTPEERQALDQLALTATLLDVLPICIGTAPHKVGDSWKTDIPAPRGKAVGYIVPKDIACTFATLAESPDGPLATLTITGSLSLERPLGYNSHVDITFEATLVRRLSDMLDLDTQIKGSMLLKGEANILGAGKTQLDFDYPFTLARTLKIEPK